MQLVIYPTGAGEKRYLERGNLEAYRWASGFPDGRRILVCGNEAGKAARCYVQDVSGGPPRPVTEDGERGVVSPDGKRVAVWRPESVPVIYRLDGGNPEALPSVSEGEVPIRWSPDGRSLLFIQPERIPGRIERVDIASGKRELVCEFAPPERTGVLLWGEVCVAADSRSYAYSYHRTLSQLYLVEGAG